MKNLVLAGFGAILILMLGQTGIVVGLAPSLDSNSFLGGSLSLFLLFLGLVVAVAVTILTRRKEATLRKQTSIAEENAKDLKWQASHDPLTRLLNRHEFRIRVEQACRRSQAAGDEHVLLFLDLDQFKIVNDTCGHHAGDVLLRQLAVRMRACVEPTSILARMGGDSFGLLLLGADMKQGYETAESLRQAVQDFRFFWQGSLFEVSVSAGVVSIDRDHCHIREVLNAADSACYEAKRMGRNRIRLVFPDDGLIEAHRGEGYRAQELPRAIRENRMELYVQEIHGIKGSNAGPMHYELLVRMRQENGDILTPDQFIPVAERFGFAVDLDRWVVRETFSWLSGQRCAVGHCESPEQCHLPCHFSINLSGFSLSDEAFLCEVEELFDQYAVDPKRICFEVTETAVVTHMDAAKSFIHRLKQLGCRFALDDFGSGMSSFGYLQELDVDYVKIDGCLVREVARGGLENAMVVAIVHVAQHMKAETIAEYVEDELTVNALQSSGVDFLQGFLLHKPMPLANLSLCRREDQSEHTQQMTLGLAI
jgi:diguanylate cyclase (GGDEF)-like protein